MDRTILHCDMNNCYASIECLLNPILVGKPIAVGGNIQDRHGIILAKSEEAKQYGVRTGEVIYQAQKKCKDLIIVQPHYDKYVEYSQIAKNIYYEYSNYVEPFGIDEAWLDCSYSTSLFGNGMDIARKISHRMKHEVGITVSIGVSYNKIFAKLGSSIKKPDSIIEIRRSDLEEKVWRLDVSELLGVGKATRRKLYGYGIVTIGDLANIDEGFIKKLLGINGVKLKKFANGENEELVKDVLYKRDIKSIGRGTTFVRDLVSYAEARRGISELAVRVSKALRKEGLKARGIFLHIKWSNLKSDTVQFRIAIPTFSANEIELYCINTFRSRFLFDRGIRAITIRGIDLVKGEQPYQSTIFDDFDLHLKRELVDTAAYEINKKFGDNCIRKASQLLGNNIPQNILEEIKLPRTL